MKNYLLSLTRQSIPYIKELRPKCGTIAGCILMQQLDYWFAKKPNGFHKFKSPCKHPLYVAGDSWTEEIGISDEEFTVAFSKIGLAHKSRTLFDNCEDKFKGCFYCSYFDRQTGLTYYFRNHDVVDSYIGNLLSVNHESRFTETVNHGLHKPIITVSVNHESRFTETVNHGISIYTENTTENTTENNLHNDFSSEKILSNFSETEISEKKEIPVVIPVEAEKEKKEKKVAPKKEKKEKVVDPRTRPQLHDSFIKIYDDFHKRVTNTVIPNSKWSQQVTGIKGLRIAIIESVENYKNENNLTPPTDNEVLKTFEGFLKKAWAVSNEFHQSQFSPNHLNTNFIQFTNKIKNNNNGKSNSNNNQTDKLTTEQRQTLNTYKPAQPVYASADFAV